jgi:hypothetical protein
MGMDVSHFVLLRIRRHDRHDAVFTDLQKSIVQTFLASAAALQEWACMARRAEHHTPPAGQMISKERLPYDVFTTSFSVCLLVNVAITRICGS